MNRKPVFNGIMAFLLAAALFPMNVVAEGATPTPSPTPVAAVQSSTSPEPSSDPVISPTPSPTAAPTPTAEVATPAPTSTPVAVVYPALDYSAAYSKDTGTVDLTVSIGDFNLLSSVSFLVHFDDTQLESCGTQTTGMNDANAGSAGIAANTDLLLNYAAAYQLDNPEDTTVTTSSNLKITISSQNAGGVSGKANQMLVMRFPVKESAELTSDVFEISAQSVQVIDASGAAESSDSTDQKTISISNLAVFQAQSAESTRTSTGSLANVKSESGDSAVMLSWDPATTDAQEYYRVKYNTSNDEATATTVYQTITKDTDDNRMYAVISGLTNYNSYYFWIARTSSDHSSEYETSELAQPVYVSSSNYAPSVDYVTITNNTLVAEWTYSGSAEAYGLQIDYVLNNATYKTVNMAVTAESVSVALSGLQSGSTVQFSVKSCSSKAGAERMFGSAASSPVTAMTEDTSIAQPGNVSVISGDTSALISWKGTSSLSYMLFYSTSADLTTATAADCHSIWESDGMQKVALTKLTNGQEYHFWIFGLSKSSNTAGAPYTGTMTPAVDATMKPQNVKAVSGEGTISLTWNSTSGTTPVYEIGVVQHGSTNLASYYYVGNTNSYVITGLTNGTQYDAYVMAGVDWYSMNHQVYSAVSDTLTVTPVEAEVKLADISNIESSVGINGARFDWDYDGTNKNVIIQYSTTDDITKAISSNVQGTVNSAKLYSYIGNLLADQTYYCWLTVYNSDFTSKSNALKTTINTKNDVLAAPAGVTATGGETEINVSWSPVAGATCYRINYSSSGYSSSYTSTNTSASISYLSANTEYTLTVQAARTNYDCNYNVLGIASNSVTVSTKEATADLGTISNLVATSGVSSIGIKWDAVSGVSNYKFYYGTETEMPSTPNDFSYGSTVGKVIRNLTDGTTYHLWVVGYNSDETRKTTVGTIDAVPGQGVLPKPTNVAVTYGDEQVHVSWDAVTNAKGYIVSIKKASEEDLYYNFITYESDENVRSITISHQENGTTYDVAVAASEGQFGYETLQGTRSDLTEVTPVAAKETLTNALQVQTDASYDAARVKITNQTGIAGYFMYYGTVDDISKASKQTETVDSYSSSGTTSFYITSLTPHTKYYFWTAGYDTLVQNRTPYVKSSVTVGENTFAAPQNVVATPGGGSVTVSWDAVSGAGSYEVMYREKGTTYGNSIVTEGTSYKIRYLQNDQEYEFIVRAAESNEDSYCKFLGYPSDTVSATPKAELGDYSIMNLTTGQKYEEYFDAWTPSSNSELKLQLLPNKDGSQRTVRVTSLYISEENSVSIDLNGQILTSGTTDNGETIINYGTLTIKDSSANKSGILTNQQGNPAIINQVGFKWTDNHNCSSPATVTVESGTVKSLNSSYKAIRNQGNLLLSGGTVSGIITNGYIIPEEANWSGSYASLIISAGDLSNAAIKNGDYSIYQNSNNVAVKSLSSPYQSGNSHFILYNSVGRGTIYDDAEAALKETYPIASGLDAVADSNSTLSALTTVRTGSTLIKEKSLAIFVSDGSELNGQISSLSYRIQAYAYDIDYQSSGDSRIMLSSSRVELFPASGQDVTITLRLPDRFIIPASGKLEVVQTRSDSTEDISTVDATTGSNGEKLVTFVAKNGLGTFQVRAANATVADTLQKQIDAVQGGSINFITLQKDYTENITIARAQNVVLNMNGHTLSSDGTSDTITNDGTLTIEGSGTIASTGSGHSAIVNQSHGQMTVKNGTIQRTAGTGSAGSAISNQGTLKLMSGTTVSSNETAAPAIQNGWTSADQNVAQGEAFLYVYGGTVKGGSYNIDNIAYGTADITGGTMSGGATGAFRNKNIIKINGPTADAAAGTVLANEYDASGSDCLRAFAEIKQGKFKGKLSSTGGTLVISGGMFDQDPTAFLDSGLTASTDTSDSNYKYEVKEIVAAAGTLQSKIDQQKGDVENVITVDKDYTESLYVDSSQNVVIDLNGHTLTGNAGTATITNRGKLVIKNSGTAGKVTNASGAAPVILNQPYGEATIDSSVTVTDEGASGITGTVIENQGNMIMKGQAVSTGTASSLILNGYLDYQRNQFSAAAKLIVDGAKLQGGLYNLENTYYGIATVQSGSFDKSLNGAIQNRHMLYIYDGTFSKGSSSAEVLHNVYSADEHKTYVAYMSGYTQIYGGKFTGTVADDASGELDIYSGYYTEDPTAYLPYNKMASTTSDVAGYAYQVVDNVPAAGTLQAQIDAVPGDVANEITLDKDYTENIVINSLQKVIIHLNGHKIVNASDKETISNSGNLTIDGTGSVENSGSAPVILNHEYAIATVMGSASINKSGEANAILNHGDLRLTESSKVTGNSTAYSLVLNGWPTVGLNMINAASDLTIDGTVMTGGKYNVENSYYGRAEITSGNFSGSAAGAVLNLNQMTIYNGIFSFSSGTVVANAVQNSQYQYTKPDFANAVLTIFNGKFDGNITNDTSAVISVYGGYYTANPADFLAFGIATNDITVTPYKYEAVKAELKVTGSTEATQVVAADTSGMSSETIQAVNTVTNTLSENAPVADGLDKSALEYAKTFTDNNLALINQKIQENDASVTGIDLQASNVNIYTTQSLVVQVQNAVVDSSNSITEIQMDVKLNSKTVISSASDAASANEYNSIVLEEKHVETKQPITITLDLPSTYKISSDVLTIKHILNDGSIKYYTGAVTTKAGTTTKQVTFTDEDGFSTLIVMPQVTQNQTAMATVVDGYDTTGQAGNAFARLYPSSVDDLTIRKDMQNTTTSLLNVISSGADSASGTKLNYYHQMLFSGVAAGAYKLAISKNGYICTINSLSVGENSASDPVQTTLYYLGDTTKDGQRKSEDVYQQRINIAKGKSVSSSDLLVSDMDLSGTLNATDAFMNRILIAKGSPKQ